MHISKMYDIAQVKYTSEFVKDVEMRKTQHCARGFFEETQRTCYAEESSAFVFVGRKSLASLCWGVYKVFPLWPEKDGLLSMLGTLPMFHEIQRIILFFFHKTLAHVLLLSDEFLYSRKVKWEMPMCFWKGWNFALSLWAIDIHTLPVSYTIVLW